MHKDLWSKTFALTMALVLLAALVVAIPPACAQEDEELPLSFSANALARGNIGTGRTINLVIRVEGWTSDEDRNKMLTILAEEGPEAMHKALTQQDSVGSVRPRGQTITRVRYTRNIDTGEGRIIRMVTDRAIAFAENVGGTRSRDYNFTIIELNLDKEGRGTGSVIVGARIKFDDQKRLVVEAFDSRPVELRSVRLN